jgi:hypothetical protein
VKTERAPPTTPRRDSRHDRRRRDASRRPSASLAAFFRATAGKCFNCLARDLRAVDCRDPVRCFRCRRSGHRERHCREKQRQPPSAPPPPPPQAGSHGDHGREARERDPDAQMRERLERDRAPRRAPEERRRRAAAAMSIGPYTPDRREDGDNSDYNLSGVRSSRIEVRTCFCKF